MATRDTDVLGNIWSDVWIRCPRRFSLVCRTRGTQLEESKVSERYNGWKNYQTWNVALWIGNDEVFYDIAKDCENYEHFREIMMQESSMTPDAVMWDDIKLDIDELDEMIKETI